jgi:serine/threonine protein kinase
MRWREGDQLVEGRFKVLKILGEGGFGITYLVRDLRRLDRREGKAVIKTLGEDLRRDPDLKKFRLDFMNEALRLARCNHRHVVEVYEFVETEDLLGIVMEFVQGKTLQEYYREKRYLPETEAILYIRQIGEALCHLHKNEILHRDLKPSNILLRDSSKDMGKETAKEAVLIDFGLARDFSQGMFQRHTAYGTEGFAPPEQYDSRGRRGAFIDVYGLAATLYTLTTGEVPICAPARMMGRDLDPPKVLNPIISQATQNAILQGMSLNLVERPQTIEDWLTLLPDFTPGISTQDLSEIAKYYQMQPSDPSPQVSKQKDKHSQTLKQEDVPLGSSPDSQVWKQEGAPLKSNRDSQASKQADPLHAPNQDQDSVIYETLSRELGLPQIHPSTLHSGPVSSLIQPPPRRVTVPPTRIPLKNEEIGSSSDLPSDFRYLRNLLASYEWEMANQETTRLMLSKAQREKEGHFCLDSIKAFPCSDLCAIDALWLEYSQGKFGFQVQKKLWAGVNSEIFAGRVGWKNSQGWVSYHQLNFSLHAPAGHLPVGFLAGYSGGFYTAFLLLDFYVRDKFRECFP